MAYPMGEAKLEPLRVDFDRRLKLEFHGSDFSSNCIEVRFGSAADVQQARVGCPLIAISGRWPGRGTMSAYSRNQTKNE